MKERIKNLLIQGLKPIDVSGIVGCTPAYISQLLSSPDFVKEIELGRSSLATEKSEEQLLDQRYENTEQKILNRINEELNDAELPQLINALKVVGERADNRKKIKLPATHPANPLGTGAVTNVQNNIHITQVALPSHTVRANPVVEMNEKSEIIAINGQLLAPMSADGVRNIFATKKQEKEAIALPPTQAQNLIEQL